MTLIAYFPFEVIPNVAAICELVGSTTNTTPFQSGVKSEDLQLGQTFPIVINLHFLQAISLAIVNLPQL